MEIFGFLGAILGIITAIIKRKKIVVHRYESNVYSSSDDKRKDTITIKKRFKRLIICLILAFICAAIGGSNKLDVMAWPFFLLLFMAFYQIVTIIITLFVRLWR